MKHRHHIIPRHAGGTDDPSNIVELTIEEHAEAHRLLYEEHGCWQDKVAWLGLAGMIDHQEVIYEVLRNNALGKIPSAETRAKMSKSQKGRKHSEETKRKMSESSTFRRLSQESRAKARESRKKNGKHRGESHWTYGKQRDEETRKKISEALK